MAKNEGGEVAGLIGARLRLLKKFGVVMTPDLDMGRLPTGMEEFDKILGGGLPRGRIIELFGKESTGKSTLMLALARIFLDSGEHVVWADYEGAYEQKYATKMGLVEGENLIVIRPDTMEQGFDIFYELMASQPRGVYVIDSLAAAMPDLEKIDEKKRAKGKSNIGDTAIGAHARALSTCLRQINGMVAQSGATVILINQMRTKLDGFRTYKTTTGGFSLKYYTAMRLGLTRKGTQNREIGGVTTRCLQVQLTVSKTKVSETEKEVIQLWVVPGVGVTVKKTRGEKTEPGEVITEVDGEGAEES